MVELIPNPAAVYCEEKGYIYEIREGEGGQYGVCINPLTGKECDGWAFYNGECSLDNNSLLPIILGVGIGVIFGLILKK